MRSRDRGEADIDEDQASSPESPERRYLNAKIRPGLARFQPPPGRRALAESKLSVQSAFWITSGGAIRLANCSLPRVACHRHRNLSTWARCLTDSGWATALSTTLRSAQPRCILRRYHYGTCCPDSGHVRQHSFSRENRATDYAWRKIGGHNLSCFWRPVWASLFLVFV